MKKKSLLNTTAKIFKKVKNTNFNPYLVSTNWQELRFIEFALIHARTNVFFRSYRQLPIASKLYSA
jgi:hypothetical protein